MDNINFRKYIAVEDFILDNDFVTIINSGNQEDINSLYSLYPEKYQLINEAIILLKFVQIDCPEQNVEQIDEDWRIIQRRIQDKKNKKRKTHTLYLTISSIAASLAILLFVLSPNLKTEQEKEHLFSLLESTEMHTGEIQIIAGENKTNVANNEIVTQTEKGDIIVGLKEEINSSAIVSEYVTVVVPKGRRITLNLSDGSKLWVNSETKIAYPKVFSEKTREISVDGEVYLEVAKATIPFIVHTKELDVKVLGTEFNIRAYSLDSEKSVVLVNGSVEVKNGFRTNKLNPNQGYFAIKEEGEIRNIDVSTYICWKDEIMILNGESLDVILTRLGRHYGLDIQSTKRFQEEKYVGKINLKESIETVLSNISLSTKLKYTRIDDTIYVE